MRAYESLHPDAPAMQRLKDDRGDGAHFNASEGPALFRWHVMVRRGCAERFDGVEIDLMI
jgi:hypothetical protein